MKKKTIAKRIAGRLIIGLFWLTVAACSIAANGIVATVLSFAAAGAIVRLIHLGVCLSMSKDE